MAGPSRRARGTTTTHPNRAAFVQARLGAATAHHQAGRLDAALCDYDAVLRVDPGHPVAANLSGLILLERAQSGPARERFALALRLASSLDPNRANIANNLGLACAALGDHAAAAAAFTDALAVAPDHVPALHNLALARRRLGDLDAAAGAIRAALAIEPERPDSHGVLGAVLLEQGRVVAAATAFRRAVALGEPTGEAAAGLGDALRLLGRFAEAERSLERAVALQPERADVRSTLALTLSAQGRHHEALAQAGRASELPSANRAVRVNEALLRLVAGHDDGWDRLEQARGRWPLDPLDGRDVFVTKEEGVGDQLLYATCVPDLAHTARSVTVECDPRLQSLLSRTHPDIAFVAAPAAPPPTHAVVGLGSLPARLRRTPAPFPAPTPLVAPPDAVQAWAAWLARLGPGPKVGISWRSMVITAERQAEYASLTEWEPLLTRPGVTFVNLQYDDCGPELAEARARTGATVVEPDGLDLIHDLEGVAALMGALDAVVAPRNAVAMLAAACDRPTVMLGNRYDWFDLGLDIEHTGSPWFPSVHPVLRDRADDWRPTLTRAAGVLDALLAAHRPTTTTATATKEDA